MKNKFMKITVILLIILFLATTIFVGTKNFFSAKEKQEDKKVIVPGNIIKNKEKENDDSKEVISTDNEKESDEVEAKLIEFYKNHNEDNEIFNVSNMLPGDIVTKYYSINVSYKDEATIRYKLDVIKSDNLLDVLKIKVNLLNDNNVLYDGLVKDMPDELIYKINKSDEIQNYYYEISMYLDENVGDDYQNKEFKCNFVWYVDDDTLEENPNTGDSILKWVSFTLISGLLLAVCMIIMKKRGK